MSTGAAVAFQLDFIRVKAGVHAPTTENLELFVRGNANAAAVGAILGAADHLFARKIAVNQGE